MPELEPQASYWQQADSLSYTTFRVARMLEDFPSRTEEILERSAAAIDSIIEDNGLSGGIEAARRGDVGVGLPYYSGVADSCSSFITRFAAEISADPPAVNEHWEDDASQNPLVYAEQSGVCLGSLSVGGLVQIPGSIKSWGYDDEETDGGRAYVNGIKDFTNTIFGSTVSSLESRLRTVYRSREVFTSADMKEFFILAYMARYHKPPASDFAVLPDLFPRELIPDFDQLYREMDFLECSRAGVSRPRGDSYSIYLTRAGAQRTRELWAEREHE